MLDSFLVAIQHDFPKQKPRHHVEYHLDPQPEAAPAIKTSKQVGYICWTNDNSHAIQARLDGFTLNCIKSYKNWEHLLRQAQEWWPLYVGSASPAHVVRCRLRYMNRIALEPGIDLRDYLRTVPAIPEELPSEVSSFALQLAFPFPEGRSVTIRQAIQPDSVLLFDIDASSSRIMDPHSSALWNEFEALRDIKNQIFFSLLTPKAWEKYQ